MTKLEAYNDSVQFLGVTRKNGVGDSELYTQKPLSAADAFNCSRGLAAYRVNQEGLLELVGEDVPRIDYSNGCPEILIENESENIIIQSESLTSSFSGVVGTNDAIAPDGTMTADSFNVTDNTNGGTNKAITLVNGNTYTYSVWLKGSVNGQKVLAQTDFNGDLTTFILPTNWVRYSVTFVANSSAAQNIYLLNGLYVSPTSNDIYYVWGQQLELGENPTSYIPTTTVAVTRPADVIENDAIDYTQDEATIFVRARLQFSDAVQGVISLYDGSVFDDYISIYIQDISGTKTLALTTYTNPDQNDVNIAMPDVLSAIYSIAVAYNLTTSEYSLAINGTIESTGTFANTLPTSTPLTTMALGRISSFYDARIVGMMFFNSKLDDSSLENLTTQ